MHCLFLKSETITEPATVLLLDRTGRYSTEIKKGFGMAILDKCNGPSESDRRQISFPIGFPDPRSDIERECTKIGVTAKKEGAQIDSES